MRRRFGQFGRQSPSLDKSATGQKKFSEGGYRLNLPERAGLKWWRKNTRTTARIASSTASAWKKNRLQKEFYTSWIICQFNASTIPRFVDQTLIICLFFFQSDMNKKIIFLVAASILIAGCSKQQNTTSVSNPKPVANEVSNLKPVTGACGYNLGDKSSVASDDPAILRDMPPFQMLTISKTSDERICRIVVSGVEEGEDPLHETQKRLIAVLAEKYGARDKIGPEKYLNDTFDTDLYFGTPNRVAHLEIRDWETNRLITVEYYDGELMGIYNKEQQAKDKVEDDIKKASLKKGL